MGYHRAGFQVVGVDNRHQPHYPFEFIQSDAVTILKYLGSQFDVIHASPPCQRWSVASGRWNGRRGDHPDYITEIRSICHWLDRPYILENVPGAPLHDPVTLCGSSFGLGVRRHRLFESNRELIAPPCKHELQQPKYRIYDHGRWYMSPVVHVHGHGGGKAKGEWPVAMGIDWMSRKEMSQAIPPDYTEWLGRQLWQYLV